MNNYFTIITFILLGICLPAKAVFDEPVLQVNKQQVNQTTILFGSCSHQDKPMPIFDAILKEQADAFIFLGDNIYGDTEDMQTLKDKYQKLGNRPSIQQLRASMPVFAIWDDHDFGENDAGKEYPFKAESKNIMLDFWGVPLDSPRRARTDGLYGSYVIGSEEQSIRIILPDLRYSRDPISSVGAVQYLATRKLKDMGPYKKSEGSMLGEAQWLWLESELQKPEKIKIIGSSLQLLAYFTGWESWANYADRQRLFGLIKKHKSNGIFILSGDTHWGEISKVEANTEDKLDYPLWDVTSSGLTEEWKQVSPNKYRAFDYTDEVNYGFLTVTWAKEPSLYFGLKDVKGDIVMDQRISLLSISPY
ncbi:MAG: alkaline phosphatase D [Kangiellaceae bacterium]|jgi:alkaline phosphatase D